MQVTILQATENPVDLISMAAGICYGKDNVSTKRVEHCYNNEHLSVFEHVYVTFKIEGISRACLAQLTRHRHCSFCVESQRYCRYDLADDDWYVVPPKIAADEAELKYYKACMNDHAVQYRMQIASGIKPEDARFMLPESAKTNLIMSCNLRELFHIFDMRMSQSAQWEIRELASSMFHKLQQRDEQWQYLMDLWKKEDD